MLKYFFRIALGALFLFEFANYVNALNMTPDYTWFGLWFVLLSVVFVLEGVNVWMQRKFKKELHWSNWALVFAVLAFDASGDVFHFYSRFEWYDQLGHFLGGFVTMYVFSAILKMMYGAKGKLSDRSRWMYGFALAAMMGSFYEIEEYLEDFFSRSNRLGSGVDTANDLLLNVLGSLVVVLGFWIAREFRRGRKG